MRAYKALVGCQEHRDAGIDLADGQGHKHSCWVPAVFGVAVLLRFTAQWDPCRVKGVIRVVFRAALCVVESREPVTCRARRGGCVGVGDMERAGLLRWQLAELW